MMENYIKPAERLLGQKLNGGWVVVKKIVPQDISKPMYSSCYTVEKGNLKGFLKAFDYSDLKKAGINSDIQFKRVKQKFDRELSMLKKCRESQINGVIQLLENDSYFFKPNSIEERVDYFILEFSEDGNVLDCLTEGKLKGFGNKFQALIYIFDGLHDLHLNGIMHLDLKAENLVYFIKERLTKITDFGSARQFINEIDEDLLDDLNNISTTRQYAPPEFFYNEFWTNDFYEYRRKIDLYLAGNIIVKLFTNISFTALLKKEISEFYDWDNNQNSGKYKQFLPALIKGATEVYLIVETKLNTINEECGKPLDNKDIENLMKVISELCTPNAQQRGHPKELVRKNNRDGIDRYRDKFITLRNKCESREKIVL